MIGALQIGSFGKFRDREFLFKKLNFLFGSNESGKTTIFDALADQMLPGGNLKYRLYINERYGVARAAAIRADSEISFDPALFFNVVAVRSLKLEIDFNKDWQKSLQSLIFSGGIDGDSLLQELEKLSNRENRTFRHNRKIEELRKELAETERNLGEIDSLLAESGAAREKLPGLEQELREIGGGIDDAGKKIRETELEIKQQELFRELEQLEKRWREIGEAENLGGRIALLERFRPDESALVEEMLERRSRGERALLLLEERRKRELEILAERESEALTAHDEISGMRREFEQIQGALREFRHRRLNRPLSFWQAAVMAVTVLLAALAGLLYPQSLPAGVPLTVFLGGILLYLQRKKARRFLENIAGNRTLSFQGLGIEASSLCQRLEERERELEKSDAYLESIRLTIREIERSLESQRAELAANGERVAAFLESHGLEQLERYEAERVRLITMEQNYRTLLRNLEAEGEFDPGALRSSLDWRRRSIEKELRSMRRSDSELQALRNIRQDLESSLSGLRVREAELIREINALRGRVQGIGQALLERYANLHLRKNEICSELSVLEDELRAAEIARDIVSSLLKEDARDFSALLKEVQPLWQEFLARGEIELRQLAENKIFARDREGALRPVFSLSRSTADIFYLCLRLGLARMSLEGGKRLLIMDDPLLSMDIGRKEAALKVLTGFCRENDFQLFFFSCDSGLRQLVGDSGDLRVIDLE